MRFATSLAGVAALALAASVVTPAVAAERRAPVTITSSNAAFSPNGYGIKDSGTVSYRLSKAGRVTATVSKGRTTVLVQRLGRQGEGTRTFTWNGARRGGKVVGDGRYTVTISTTAGRARTPLEVDARHTSPVVGQLTLSSDKVYPQASLIRDVVVGSFVPGSGFTGSVGTVRRQVLDRSGEVVDSAPLALFSTGETGDSCGAACGRLTWDGRDRNGDVLPAGPYRVRLVRGTDPAGNPVVLTAPRTVTVSTRQLVARTTTTTTSAATTPTSTVGFNVGEVFGPGPVGRCEPVRSDVRFVGGLSFRSAGTSSASPCTAIEQFTGPLPTRRTPYDSYTVSATGGPTTAGAADTGALNSAGQVQELPGGTHRATRSITSFTLPNTEAPRTGAPLAISWRFATNDGSSYDLASFTYTLTQYVEAP